MKTLTIIGCAALVTAQGCTTCNVRTSEAAPTHRVDGVALLRQYLTGAFSSETQAARDPDNYFDIRLVCVEIWDGRDDGPWLYIEQAASGSAERPYRQRVYHLVDEGEGTLRSDVYALPGDPLSCAGWWRDPARFDVFVPADLELREGCSVSLELEGEAFVGGTLGEGCSSTLGEAAYATSEMTLLPNALITWDRGWTADGEQAWGATEGGYVFERVDMPE